MHVAAGGHTRLAPVLRLGQGRQRGTHEDDPYAAIQLSDAGFRRRHIRLAPGRGKATTCRAMLEPHEAFRRPPGLIRPTAGASRSRTARRPRGPGLLPRGAAVLTRGGSCRARASPSWASMASRSK